MAVEKPYFTLHEIALMSLCGALIFALNMAFSIPLHIPGHKGIFWVVPIILGVGIVRKPGSGCYIGLISGILASVFGRSALHTLDIFTYLAMGVMIDLCGIVFLYRLHHPAIGFIAGSAGNLAKMVVSFVLQTTLGIPVGFILIGIGIASITHFVFGGLGGVLAALVLNRFRKAGVIAHDG